MKGHKIELTAPEIGGLWKSYMQNTATVCLIKHLAQHVQDSEIKPLMIEQISLIMKLNEKITDIFNDEGLPIPKGFSEADVDLSAPALFTDLFGLSFIYRFNQMGLSDYATTATKVARTDIVEFFYDCIESSGKMFKKAQHLMLSKGIYDRPPKMDYPKQVEFIDKQDSIIEMWLGERRPLNAFELGEIFYTIERNSIGVLLLIGLIQVTKDKELKGFFSRGKELAEKQIDIFNKILKEDEHIGNLPVTMEVTDSTIPPFSERLATFLIATSTATGIYLTAYALSVSMRKDLIAHYTSIMTQIMKYGGEGLKIMIDRGWMEQPPQAFDRVAALKV